MREILFKAKRLDNGAWVEGSLITYKDGTAFICCEDYIPDVLNKYEVDPSTVCQYTGLTDKNGKKIFDGDVVRRETDYYGKHKVYDEPVVWEDDIEKGFLGEPYTSGYCIHGGNWEVIGSIHDGEGGQHEGAEGVSVNQICSRGCWCSPLPDFYRLRYRPPLRGTVLDQKGGYGWVSSRKG